MTQARLTERHPCSAYFPPSPSSFRACALLKCLSLVGLLFLDGQVFVFGILFDLFVCQNFVENAGFALFVGEAGRPGIARAANDRTHVQNCARPIRVLVKPIIE